ncbi:MAG: integrase core domain-containing protein [Gemmatimonadetes bacterium]|nr:integrase core domain-containing protein [Gemmatimonadota bacterium]
MSDCRYLIHDRDAKFNLAFRETLKSTGIESVMLPPKSPNLNAFAEPCVRSIKQECLSRLICFGAGSLRKAITEYVEHYDLERNHQGKANTILVPVAGDRVGDCAGPIRSRERLGCLLRFYHRGAA